MEELLQKIGLKSMVVKSGEAQGCGLPFSAHDRRREETCSRACWTAFMTSSSGPWPRGGSFPWKRCGNWPTEGSSPASRPGSWGWWMNWGTWRTPSSMAAKLAGIQGEPEVIYPEKKRVFAPGSHPQGDSAKDPGRGRRRQSPPFSVSFFPSQRLTAKYELRISDFGFSGRERLFASGNPPSGMLFPLRMKQMNRRSPIYSLSAHG